MDPKQQMANALEKVGILQVVHMKHHAQAPIPYVRARCEIINETAFGRMREYLKETMKRQPLQGGELKMRRNKGMVIFDLLLTKPWLDDAMQELISRVDCFNQIETFLQEDDAYEHTDINQMGILTPKQITFIRQKIKQWFHAAVLAAVADINGTNDSNDIVLQKVFTALAPVKKEVEVIKNIFAFDAGENILDLQFIADKTNIPLEQVTLFARQNDAL